MNKPISYILSFITSVLLVLSLLGSLIALVAMNFASPEKLYDIARDKNLSHTVWTELEKYYSRRYNTTGIPADVYMNAISENYLEDVIRTQIDNGFYVLMDWEQSDSVINTTLETALSDFYSDYADSIGVPKDAKYDEKLSEAKENASEIIADYCDVFKFRAMENHGILKKIAPFYSKLPTAVLIICGTTVFLALLLVLINIKSSSTTFWWIGISALISGLTGAVPCFYLKATDYFSAFTIKQAQVYSAYTSTMTRFVDSFMAVALISAVIGFVFVIFYIFMVKNKKYIEST